MKNLAKQDQVVLDGVHALEQFDSARAELFNAVAAVGDGPVRLVAALDEAFKALITSGEHLYAFRNKALEAYLEESKKAKV